MINVICIYKEGNGFTKDYVDILHNSIKRNTTKEFNFICIDNGEYKGWWNKINIFKITGKCIYIDLDTVIVNNIDKLFELAEECNKESFYMLMPFNPRNRERGLWASGMMIWNNDLTHIVKEFDYHSAKKRHKGDQTYISKRIERVCVIRGIQDKIRGIYSYKRNCRVRLPDDAKVVCFHGLPRPRNVLGVNWIKENWRTDV